MNILGLPVYAKGQKRKQSRKSTVSHLAPLIERARVRANEREYLDWLKTQPSALGSGWDYDWELGNVCTPAHWRTAAHAGTSQKPEWLAIPLRDAEHKLAHQKGDSVIGTRDWWERQCVEHLERWLAS